MSQPANSVCDGAERLAAIDPQRSLIVQAPAGSGKTELLVQRFLALLARVERPGEILAITFTRKAAGEMRNRLLAALAAGRGPEPEAAHARQTWRLARQALRRDGELGWELAANPGQLTILTIDGLNAGLVRQLPWVSRLGGSPRVAADPDRLYRLAARRSLALLARGEAASEPLARLLGHLDNRMDQLSELLVAMLERRDQWLPLVLREQRHLRRQTLERGLEDYVGAQLCRIQALLPAALLAEILALARYAVANLEAGEGLPLRNLVALGRLPATAPAELSAWQGLTELLLTAGGSFRRRLDKRSGFPPGKGEAAVMKQRLLEVIEELQQLPGCEPLLARLRRLPPACYGEEQWQVLEALIDLLPRVVAELWLVFREEGAIDFAEMALRALQALGEGEHPSDLLLKLDAGLRHILVDEFQDTSRLQCSLLEKLTSGWDPQDGRTLFLVGDPMQSIYRFREAEVGLFLRARAEGLNGLSLTALRLRSNFRSQQGLVDWVNQTMPGIFPQQEDDGRGAVPFAPAEATRPPLAEGAAILHSQVGRDDRAEALATAELVQQALLRPGETVAVLVRSRNHLQALLQVLREQGIRYQARDIDPLASRPVARDLVALCRALLHRGDRLSWLAILRAPWCGLTLGDLQHLCEDAPQRTIFEVLTDPAVVSRLSVDGQLRAQRVGQVMATGLAKRGQVGLRPLVEGCWLALGGAVCLDPAALNDAARIFELLEELDVGGDLGALSDLDEGLRRLFAGADGGADGRLQVMTIHKAKGLEFDTVIVPGLGRKPRSGGHRLLRWQDHPRHGLLLAPISPRDGRSRDPIYEALGSLEQDKEELEVVRLLYVAVTRAKQRLHLLGHLRCGSDGTLQPAAGSLLALLGAMLDTGTPLLGTKEDSGSGVEDPMGCRALIRLPTAWQLPEFQPAPLPRAEVAASPSHAGPGEGAERKVLNAGSDTGRLVGIEVHVWLERLARDGKEIWSRPQCDTMVGRNLVRLGVTSADLAGACAAVRTAIDTTLQSVRGQWILHRHSEAANELALSGKVGEQLVHAVIDRTFVENGTRWIVDYKTSVPQSTAVATFLHEEMARYRRQLQLYAELFRQLEPGRPLRVALYFPRCDGWQELPLSTVPLVAGAPEAGVFPYLS